MTSPTSARDPWLDNAKMGLVMLVVIGHAWTLLPADGVVGHAYDFLYAWHMPAFVFVTGYLSRSFTYTPDRLWSLVRTVVVPYLIFELLMASFRIHVGGEHLEDLFLNPHWPMWYLAALVVWRLVTPLFRPLPAAVAVAAAVAVGVGSGTLTGDGWEVLDLTRALGLLPFFVLGVHTTPERLERLRGPGARAAAVATLGFLWWSAGHTDRLAETQWFYFSTPYAELGASDTRGVLIRLGLVAAGVAGTLAFLALVPRVGGWFARMGAATLVVYLCHGFAVRGLEYAGYEQWAADHRSLAPLVTLLGSVLLALALAAPPVARRLQLLVDPFGRAERRMTEAVELSIEAARAEEPGNVRAMTTPLVGAGSAR